MIAAFAFSCASYGQIACSEKNWLVESNSALKVCHKELNIDFTFESKRKRVLSATYYIPRYASTVRIINTGRYLKSRYLDPETQLTATSYPDIYDKATLVPPTSVVSNQAQSDMAFSMINLFPLDREAWRGDFGEAFWRLADWERTLYLKKGEVKVITGLIWPKNTNTESVQQPEYLYKVYYSPQTKLTLAYLLPTIKSLSEDRDNYITSIGCIEAKSGSKFFTSLPEKLRKRVIASKARSKTLWARPAVNNLEVSCA